MNPLELRLGNTIGWEGEESVFPHTVTIETLQDLIYIQAHPDDPEDRFARFGNRFTALPITPEILQQCGFEKCDKEWYKLEYSAFEVGDEGVDEVDSKFLFHRVAIQVNVESFRANIWNLTHDEQGATPKPKVRYLHQLQNLFYALTGRDLTPQPTPQPQQ